LVIQPKERIERRDHLGEKDKDGMIILNLILKKLDSSVSSKGLVDSSCDHGKE
jgi:hypothetical protein